LKKKIALRSSTPAPLRLTNLLVKRAADLLDEVTSVQIRLYESSESDDPISQWSPEVSFDEAISHPRIYRQENSSSPGAFRKLRNFASSTRGHSRVSSALRMKSHPASLHSHA